jgi:hypothetical protein
MGIIPKRLLGNGMGAKLCHHDRASKDADRRVITTSSRSSAIGASLAFTMPLVPLALDCFKHHGPSYI